MTGHPSEIQPLYTSIAITLRDGRTTAAHLREFLAEVPDEATITIGCYGYHAITIDASWKGTPDNAQSLF
jgi:hypothetical protein